MLGSCITPHKIAQLFGCGYCRIASQKRKKKRRYHSLRMPWNMTNSDAFTTDNFAPASVNNYPLQTQPSVDQ
jgi:hypothetical protein